MAVTKETFLAAYPEFSDKPEAVIVDIITRNSALISKTAWRDFQDIAIMLLTAHRLALRFPINDDSYLPQNMAGAITSMDVSNTGMSIQSAQSGGQDDRNFKKDLNQTTYGRELLSLMDTQISPGILT